MERGIIFSTEEVKAILDGSKTQTRRVIKPQPYNGLELKGMIFNWQDKAQAEFEAPIEYRDGYLYAPYGTWMYHPLCPYGQAGDRLWVRETFYESNVGGIIYKAGELPSHYNNDGTPAFAYRSWQPSIHMPRWASRITLENGQRIEVVRALANTADDYNIRWVRHGPKWNDGRVLLPGDSLWHWDWDFILLGL